MHATICNSHCRKDTTNKSPDMFTHLKHVGAKITTTELRLVLCCHLVDSGGNKCFAAKRDIYIYNYIYIYIYIYIYSMIMTD